MSKPDKTDDRTLVARFKAGDENAFEILVKKYSGRAYQLAYGVLGNCEDAEEVAEDVFIRIHRALANFRGDSEFTTWMYRIALNLAKNKYRWNKSRGAKFHISIDAPLEGDDSDDRKLDLPDDRLTPDRTAEHNELQQNVEINLQKLPPQYREALIMRNVEELSYEEMAKLLKCKIGTVKSRLSRAREELRKRLGL